MLLGLNSLTIFYTNWKCINFNEVRLQIGLHDPTYFTFLMCSLLMKFISFKLKQVNI